MTRRPFAHGIGGGGVLVMLLSITVWLWVNVVAWGALIRAVWP